MERESRTAPGWIAESLDDARSHEARANDRLFRLLVDAVQDYAIYLLDPDGRVASWNQGAERLKGYTADEILGRHFSILLTEEDREDGVPEQALRLAVEHGCYEQDGWRVRKDGSRFWAHFVITPIRDEHDRLLGFAKVTRDLTRQRAAERGLKESEERYRLLVDMIPQHIWTTDPDGYHNYFSRRWYDFTGTAPGQTRGEGWLRLLHPSDRERTLERWRHSLRTGEPYAIEYRFRNAEGEYCWFLGQAAPQRDETGKIVRWFGTLTDISERKRLDEEREQLLTREREAREQVTSILESITDAFVAVDDEWRFTYLNSRGREVIQALGPSAGGELIGRNLWEALPELRGTLFEEIHRRAMAERRPMQLESYFAPWDRWFEVYDYPSADGLSVYFRDVTRRKAAEKERERLLGLEREARAEAERRARAEQSLREAVGAVGALSSSEKVIRQIAHSAVDATGAGGALVTWIHPEWNEVEVVARSGDVPPTRAAFPYAESYARRVIEGQAPPLVPRLAEFEGPPWAEHLPRAYDDWSVLVVPLTSTEEPFGALILLRQAERPLFSPEEITRAHIFGELTGLAFHKLRLLEEAQRRREELERITESRTHLMRGFSHDVKNPLGAADGYAQLLEEEVLGSLSPKQREGVQRIRRSIQASLHLIHDLLELARAEAGQIEIETVPTDLAELAREVAEDFRAQAGAAGLGLEVRAADALRMGTDPTRVRQILSNLLSNAVKYTPEGRITVEIDPRPDGHAPRRGEWIAIRVTDTGPGIPPAKREAIFQEFTRLDPAAQHGAGVGLAISRRIARLLDGDITVESEEGRGSTFSLWLPWPSSTPPPPG